MVSSHCTIIKFFNNANIIHFLTNSKFSSNYFTFYIHITLSAKTSQHHNKMQNKAYFRLIQALSFKNNIFINSKNNIEI